MRILLYAPSLTGHPQVYCRVIGDILLEAGHQVVLAAAMAESGGGAQWRDLRPFEDHPRVQIVDTRRRSAAGLLDLTAEEMKSLQQDFRIDSTLMMEADRFADEFRRIAEDKVPRLHGKTVGIFARTSGWFPREKDYGGASLPPFGGSLRARGAWLRSALFRSRETQAWFYQELLIRRRAVDAVVVKDERTAERFGPPVFWMPEIYKVFGGNPAERRMADWETLAGPVQEYIQQAGASNVLLFFGTGAWYKGYDLFLRLAELDPSIFALHAGAPERNEPSKQMAFDTAAIRELLRRQKRLFETQAYIESEDLIHLLFGSIDRFVSTHRLTLSSGTALQALDAGKPIVTPAGGLVGWRTRQYNLGMTYRYFDDRDLAATWHEFSRIPATIYSTSIAAFMQRFSREEVAHFFLSQLCGS